MLAIGVNHNWDACPRKGSTQAPVHPPNASHMSLMKTSLTIIPMCPRERFSLYKNLSRLVLCYKRDWATLLAPYLLLLLVARYNLSYRKTICYHLFQYLQRIPCWKPLISLGSTLLLIERTTIDPLYLWVIRRRSR